MKSESQSRTRLFVTVTVLLAVAVVAVIWLTTAPNEPPPTPLATKIPKSKSRPPVPVAPPPPTSETLPNSRSIDPEIQQLADNLAAKTESPSRDLEMVDEFIDLYRRIFQQGNPIGLNEDITSVLIGHNAKKGVLFPPDNPMIVKGQLVDRWGTPYWFHPNSGHQMEIRSAGPDKELFTADDVVKNPGPDNMGIGPASVGL